ncbi:MAG: LysE family translocator [Desulfatiglandales bacterium]
MLFYFLQGATLAVSAAIMPGPYQAYLLSQALRHGWKRALPAAFAPLATDGFIIAMVLFVLTRTPQAVLEMLRVAGGFFILYLAIGIFMTFGRAKEVLTPPENAARQTFINAFIINVLNPNPYIFWGVVGGPIILTGWRTSPGLGIIFLAGFYGTFICSLAALIIMFASAGRLDPKVNRVLGCGAALALVAFGLYQIVTGLKAVF